MSHCVLVHEEFVIHSNVTGVNIQFIGEFLEDNTVVGTIEIKNRDPEILQKMSEYTDYNYDFFALSYLGLKLLLGKIGIKLPKQNL
mgnify:CR=1 FL=1